MELLEQLIAAAVASVRGETATASPPTGETLPTPPTVAVTPVPPPPTVTATADGYRLTLQASADPRTRLRELNIETRYVTDPAEAAAIAGTLANSNREAIGVDIETAARPEYRTFKNAALYPPTGAIRLFQAYNGNGTAYVFDLFRVPLPALERLFTAPLIAHNAVFELGYLLANGIAPDRLHCTNLLTRIVDGKPGSLASICERRLNLPVDKTFQTFDYATPELPPDAIAYAALDAVLAKRLWRSLRADADNTALHAYDLLRQVQPVIARQQLNGVPFDRDAQRQLTAQWRNQADTAAATARAIFGDGVKLDSNPALATWITGNLDPDTVRQWQRTPTGKLATDADTLTQYADRFEFVKVLLTYREAAKRVSTYGDGYAAFVNPATGRIHPGYRIAYAANGRFSCSQPNLQNVPRDRDFRALIKADPGYRFVVADYGQIELRVAALLANDRAMLDAYRRGDDLHRLTAAAIAGVSPDAVTKAQRQAAKAINFGSLYGQGAAGLVRYAKASYGVTMTLDEAKAARAAFFAAYPELRRWQKVVGLQVKASNRIATASGRVRVFPANYNGFLEGEALNTIVAGTAADMLYHTLIELDRRIAGTPVTLVHHVHDELMLHVPEADAADAERTLTAAMIHGYRAVFPDAPVTGLVEAKSGLTWADAK